MRRRNGFSLAEIVAVLAVMGIVAAIAAPPLGAYARRLRQFPLTAITRPAIAMFRIL